MESYEELLALYNKILEENRKLKSENEELKRQLGLAEPSVTTSDLPEAVVTKHSFVGADVDDFSNQTACF